LEVDLIIERALELTAVEMKSGMTAAPDFTTALATVAQRLAGARRRVRPVVVYGGSERQTWKQTALLPWREMASFDWSGD
jgi:hypothetical protein